MSWKIRFLMATDTARGMLYLHHRAGVIQRDLKTANLLIAEGFHIKIADFGLSRKAAELHARSHTQTHRHPAFQPIGGRCNTAPAKASVVVAWGSRDTRARCYRHRRLHARAGVRGVVPGGAVFA